MARVKTFTNGGTLLPTDLNSIEDYIDTQIAATAAAAQPLIGAGGLAISKLADPGTGKVIGSSGGAAAAVNPPGYEIGYDQITGSVAVTAVTESAGTAVITCGAHTFDGGPVLLEFFASGVQFPTVAGAAIIFSLFEGATQLGELGIIQTPSGTSGMETTATLRYRFTPTAASHTYKITAHRTGGSDITVVAGVSGTSTSIPAFARFTKA